MNAKYFTRKQIFRIFINVMIISFSSLNSVGSELDKSVLKAYDLRMNGKADEAKTLLEQVISEDSSNAAALYELARTKFQMGLANPRELFPSLENIEKLTESAREHEPDNVIYAFFAGNVAFFQAYISLQRDPASAKERVKKLTGIYESVLELKPDYLKAMLFIVEINSILNADQGGDKTKAEAYAAKLEKMDKVYGAKARSLLLPEETDIMDYWKKVLEKNKDNALIYEELAKTCMMLGEMEHCQEYINQAVKLEAKKHALYLDLARYYIMSAMRSKEAKDKPLAFAEQAIEKYQSYNPIAPLDAFSWGVIARIKYMLDDKQSSDAAKEKANKIDPYRSKATGVPGAELFVKPGELLLDHKYLFRPF
ncbi:hypothetical protein H8E88_18755 [candidate division KSB1 bacterium]|nr:hypothetical protein [candidate division KSB1 bacterium]